MFDHKRVKVTKVEAVKMFNHCVTTTDFDKSDKVALREAWNNYTDGLCKDGIITENQYNKWSNPF